MLQAYWQDMNLSQIFYEFKTKEIRFSAFGFGWIEGSFFNSGVKVLYTSREEIIAYLSKKRIEE